MSAMNASNLSKQQRSGLPKCHVCESRYAVNASGTCRGCSIRLEAAKVAAKQPDPPQPVQASPKPVRRVVTARDWVRGGVVELEVTWDGTL